MTNNDVLKRLRYTFNWTNKQLIALFQEGKKSVENSDIIAWTLPENDEGYVNLTDAALASFLNGMILKLRGPNDKAMPPTEKKLTNNIIFRKLKIALNYRDEQILDALDKANFRLSKSELSAFFRKPDHKHYRECHDQILRNFLNGVQLILRPQNEPSKSRSTDS